MTIEEVEEAFEKCYDDLGHFDRIENKKSNRRDVHAFILLDEPFPAQSPSEDCYENEVLISALEECQYFLDITDEQMKLLTDENILELSLDVELNLMSLKDSLLWYEREKK